MDKRDAEVYQMPAGDWAFAAAGKITDGYPTIVAALIGMADHLVSEVATLADERDALRAKYDRLREACIFRYYDSERGYLERCQVCLCEWLDGELHKHDGWCPLAEDGHPVAAEWAVLPKGENDES